MAKDLVIVESPTKAKTISRFLDGQYTVKSSYGHVRDLPKKDMGVDIKNNFTPTYIVPERSEKTITELKKDAQDATIVYFATDEDREGEAIAWHLVKALKTPKEKIRRITFHEITKPAIEKALREPRQIDEHLVDAQQARRVLDRLVGYELSPFLWKKIRFGLSAGRVQSVAVRLIVEREEEIKAFKPQEYWSVIADLRKGDTVFAAKLAQKDNKRLDKFAISNEADAKAVADACQGREAIIKTIKRAERTRNPAPPFTTSTLQQQASSRLGFSPKQTMRLAQQLYEGISLGDQGQHGLITYMRTDSVALSTLALGEAKRLITKNYGKKYALPKPRFYKQKSKNAQEAHEAIRPTSFAHTPTQVKPFLDAQQYKLYNLIWKRALATQMMALVMDATTVDSEVKNSNHHYVFRANGSIIKFPGYLKLYLDDNSANTEEITLPELVAGDRALVDKMHTDQHFTEALPRYSEATLIKALEERGIGRPSTFAPTINTIIERQYVEKKDDRRLHPTYIGTVVTRLLKDHFKTVIDYDFTAKLEDQLDDIATGKRQWVPVISEFYKPFHANLEEKQKSLERDDVMPARELGKDPASGETVYVRNGRFGAYVQTGEWSEEKKKAGIKKPNSSSLLSDMDPETVTLHEALQLLSLPREMGQSKDGETITVNLGPYGPYLKAGKVSVSLPTDVSPLTITPDQAPELFDRLATEKKKAREPLAKLGADKDGHEIMVKTGRFGPYVTDGTTNASLGKKFEPTLITLAEATELLSKKRNRKGPDRFGKKPATQKKRKATKTSDKKS